METEILETLKEIRGVFYLFIGVVVLAVLFWGFNTATLTVRLMRESFKNSWNDKAATLYAQAKYEELIDHCSKRYETHVNDVHAYWWHARACRDKGDIEKSKKLFGKVTKLDPSWSSEFVDPFVLEMENSSNK